MITPIITAIIITAAVVWTIASLMNESLQDRIDLQDIDIEHLQHYINLLEDNFFDLSRKYNKLVKYLGIEYHKDGCYIPMQKVVKHKK